MPADTRSVLAELLRADVRVPELEATGRRGRPGRWRWHLDEIFEKINGERHCLWRAVDHEGEVLESFAKKKKRDKKAALKLLWKAMKKHDR
ncbi:hypothetical protein CDZ96_21095 [Mameliella alba]|nr:hypothetical protein CDZ96_21095 [Mameliella alba]GGF79130.1 hypothetical protein GCM10011319_44190 [Mameliella alba]